MSALRRRPDPAPARASRRTGAPRRVGIAAPAVIAALLGLFALLGYGVLARGGGNTLDEAVNAGRRPPAPALALPPLGGGAQRGLAAWRGRVVVVNFWASWCLPCRDEAPLLERWQRRLAPAGATVLGIDALDVSDDAAAFIRRHGLTYPMLRDEDGRAGRRWGTTGYPETFVIDRRGAVAALRRGPIDAGFMRGVVMPIVRERA